MINDVSIKNFIDVGDPGAPIGSPAWTRAAHVNLCSMKRHADWEVRHLKYALLEFRDKERWRQVHDDNGEPFRSWEDYFQYPEPNGLGMARESVKAVLKALNDKELLGKVLGSHGGDRRSERVREHQPDNIRLNRQYGTSRQDTIDRLRRDHPELAERVEGGELSANAAAIVAGFRRRPTPFEQIIRLLPKLTADERLQLKGQL